MRFMIRCLFLTSALVVVMGQNLNAQTSAQATTLFKTDVAGVEGRDWNVITVELRPGAVDSWHSHPGGELVYVLEGSGRLEVSGKPSITLNRGTVATISSDPHHELKNTSRTQTLKVLVVFLLEKAQQHSLLDDRRTQGRRGSREPISSGDVRQQRPNKQNESAPVGLVF